MNYKYFKVIGLQRSGTNWISEIITTNFSDVRPSNTFWKHLTPLGVKKSKLSRRADTVRTLEFRDDTFYIATMKDFELWKKSIDRKPIDFYTTHNYNENIKEVHDSWIHMRNDNLHKENFFYKNYLDWLKNWKSYCLEIEHMTGWKRKHKGFKEPTTVSKSTDFNIEKYKEYL